MELSTHWPTVFLGTKLKLASITKTVLCTGVIVNILVIIFTTLIHSGMNTSTNRMPKVDLWV